MKYISRTEIVAMILNSANGGATKTKIMYKSYQLEPITRISFYFDRKQSNRVS